MPLRFVLLDARNVNCVGTFQWFNGTLWSKYIKHFSWRILKTNWTDSSHNFNSPRITQHAEIPGNHNFWPNCLAAVGPVQINTSNFDKVNLVSVLSPRQITHQENATGRNLLKQKYSPHWFRLFHCWSVFQSHHQLATTFWLGPMCLSGLAKATEAVLSIQPRFGQKGILRQNRHDHGDDACDGHATGRMWRSCYARLSLYFQSCPSVCLVHVFSFLFVIFFTFACCLFRCH